MLASLALKQQTTQATLILILSRVNNTKLLKVKTKHEGMEVGVLTIAFFFFLYFTIHEHTKKILMKKFKIEFSLKRKHNKYS